MVRIVGCKSKASDKGGWLSGDSTSIPYLDAIHGKTVNNSTVNTKEGDCSESARSCSPVKKRAESEGRRKDVGILVKQTPFFSRDLRY
jgi:hypothetical protein